MIKLNFKDLKGKVVLKGDDNYEEGRMAWNRAIDKKPLAIVYCKNNEDIKDAIMFSRENNIPFRIRSGAHHYEGFSTGDDVLVIDVSLMNKIKVNIEENTVTIEAGVRNRELYEAVGKFGLPFPGGGCPTVGAVGYTLGGGWGYSCRHLGFGIDNLLSLKMMDYKGDILKASKNENSDLFWALKGAGGGTFGVVTEMTFNLPKKEGIGTYVVVDFLNQTMEEMKAIFKAWEKNIESLDERLNMKVAFYNSSERGIGVHIVGIFYGNKEEAKNALSKITEAGREPIYNLEEMSILDINRTIQDNHPDYEKYKSAGRFIKNEFEDSAIEEILNILKERAEGAIYTAVSLYGLGGNTRNVPKEDAAFYYRDAKGIMGFQSLYEEDEYKENNRKWLVENISIIKKYTKGSFVSFPLAETENYEDEYFGEYKDRLREIKKIYDPLNVFSFEQGIKIK